MLVNYSSSRAGNNFNLLQDVKEYQSSLVEMLRKIYPGTENVQTNWSAMSSEETTRFPRRLKSPQKMYGPEIDIAVGPFATERQFIEEYDYLMDQSQEFLIQLLELYDQNIQNFASSYRCVSFESLKLKNRNARCFIAIEIEKGNKDIKYLMGSAINAAALGRIGIVIVWSPKRLESVFRAREYLLYLDELKKNTFDTTNLVILTKEQFQLCVENLLINL